MLLWITQSQLKSNNPATRRKALEQLCEKPNFKALGMLVEALRDPDAEARKLAALAIGKLQDEACLDPLLMALRDTNGEVQVAAIQGLKRIPGEKVVHALEPLLKSPDGSVRGHAAHVLQLLGWHPANQENEIWFWAAKGQFARLGAFGALAIPALEQILASSSYGLRVGAVQTLGAISDVKTLKPLLGALKDPEAAVCVAATDALAKHGSPQVVEPISKLLRHQNSQMRLAAVEALAELRAAKMAPGIRELLKDQDWDVRRAAVNALGKLKDPAAVEDLTERLSDSDADVREAAAVALGRIGDRRAIGPLIMAFRDSASGVRRVAAASLSRVDPDWSASPEAAQAFEDLKPALEAEDQDVRHFVGHLLRGLGKAEPVALSPETASMQKGPDRTLRLAVNIFLAILSDADRDFRQAAAESLGRLKDARSRSALGRALSDSDAGVRAAAERALEQLAVDHKM